MTVSVESGGGFLEARMIGSRSGRSVDGGVLERGVVGRDATDVGGETHRTDGGSTGRPIRRAKIISAVDADGLVGGVAAARGLTAVGGGVGAGAGGGDEGGGRGGAEEGGLGRKCFERRRFELIQGREGCAVDVEEAGGEGIQDEGAREGRVASGRHVRFRRGSSGLSWRAWQRVEGLAGCVAKPAERQRGARIVELPKRRLFATNSLLLAVTGQSVQR